jgi:VCBS repeat-containing protein
VLASGITTGLVPTNSQLLSMLAINPAAPANVLDTTETSDQLAWSFNSASEAFNYLATGETLTLTYTIRATDSSSATVDQAITISITGTNDAPEITASPEIQQTLNLALTTSNHIYSFGSPENGSAEFGVTAQAPAGGFANAAAMAAAFQAHANYNNLPYTISPNSAGTQLVLTFKSGGNYGERWFERWGDGGITMTTLQDGQSNTAALAETDT